MAVGQQNAQDRPGASVHRASALARNELGQPRRRRGRRSAPELIGRRMRLHHPRGCAGMVHRRPPARRSSTCTTTWRSAKPARRTRSTGPTMKSDRRCRSRSSVAGFRARWLRRSSPARASTSVLIDGSGRAGHGVAYSTREPAHVLNVRAEVMSAWADDLEHFVGSPRRRATPRDFVQRRQFGRYLRAILDEAVASGKVAARRAQAVAASPTVTAAGPSACDDGEAIEASGAGAGDRQPAARAAAVRPRQAARRSTIRGARRRWRRSRTLAATRRGRAAGRHRADDGRCGPVARRCRPSRADRRRCRGAG